MNYVLYGEEQYLLQESLTRIVKEHVPDANELNKIVYDADITDMETILEDATTIPFFSACKIILVYHANFLGTANEHAVDTAALERYLDQPMESTVMVLIGDFEKLDARKKIVKKVQKTCRVLQYRKLDEQGKYSYVQEKIKKRGLQVEPSAMQVLLNRLPLDIRTIQTELEKLELYGGMISADVVEKLVTRPLEEDVFQLVNAVVERDLKKSFHMWQDLCVLNKDAIYLIALLASQFRFLYEVKALMLQGKGKDAIKDELKAHPYRVQLTMKTAQRLSIGYLMEILEQLATLDQNLKAGRLDKKLGFEMFLLGIQGVRQ